MENISIPVSSFPWMEKPLLAYYAYMKDLRRDSFHLDTRSLDISSMELQSPDVYFRQAPANSAGYATATANAFFLLLENDLTTRPPQFDEHNIMMEKVDLIMRGFHEVNHCITQKSFSASYPGIDEGMTESEAQLYSQSKLFPVMFSEYVQKTLVWLAGFKDTCDGWQMGIEDLRGYFERNNGTAVQHIEFSYPKERKFVQAFMAISPLHEYALRMAYHIGANHILDAVIEGAFGDGAVKIIDHLETSKRIENLYDYDNVKKARPQLFAGKEYHKSRKIKVMEAIDYGLSCIWPPIKSTPEETLSTYIPVYQKS